MRSLICVVVAALSAPVFAQAPGKVPRRTSPAPEWKEPGTAMLISAGVPLLGVAVAIGGAANGSGSVALVGVGAMALGPSLGRWYAGSAGAGSLALRTASGFAVAYGFVLIVRAGDCEGICNDTHESLGTALFLGGLGVWAGTTIYDVVMAGREADEWNSRHAIRLQPATISMAGHQAVGLALGGRF
jgi:hypothetical protein